MKVDVCFWTEPQLGLETKKCILTGLYSSAIWIKIWISTEELIDICCILFLSLFFFFVFVLLFCFSSCGEWLKILINCLLVKHRIGEKGNEFLNSFWFPSWVAVLVLFSWCVFFSFNENRPFIMKLYVFFHWDETTVFVENTDKRDLGR